MVDDRQPTAPGADVLNDATRAIVQTMREPLLVLDEGLHVRFANHSFYTVFQAAAEETIGRLIYDIGRDHQWDVPELHGLLESVLPGVESFEGFELPVEGGDGVIHNLILNARRVSAAGRRFTVLAFEDTTTARRMEGAQRETDRRLQLLIDNVRDYAFVFTDPEARITEWNIGAERILRWTEEEILGHSIAIFFTPEDRAAGIPEQEIGRAVRDGRSEDERWHLRKDGSKFFASGVLTALRDPVGELCGFVKIMRDVTERRRLATALQASEQRLSALAEALPDIVFSTSGEGACDYISRKLQEYTGAPLDPLFPLGWLHAVHPDDRTRVADEWATCVASADIYDTECRLARHDGTYRWFRLRACPVRPGDGPVEKWFGVISDINELKRSQDALVKANEELRQFAYAVSHDLHEPLRTVISFSQLLDRRCRPALDPEGQSLLDYTLHGAQRMQDLLDGLLQIVRVGAEAFELRPVDLNLQIGQVVGDMAAGIEAAQARIDWQDLPTVMADERQLRRLFFNLLGNAIKYRRREEPLHVDISAARESGGWLIRVSDNGSGFDPQYSEAIFGVFKRLHSGAVPGTGIGLAVCRRIVERMGGKIWAESQPGKGATFFFTVPAQ